MTALAGDFAAVGTAATLSVIDSPDRTRELRLGGRLDLDSEPGSGTIIVTPSTPPWANEVWKNSRSAC